jgi:nucleotide-binding universal stress UspA family protein
MRNGKRILIAVDGSEASRRAVAYVSDFIAGKAGTQVGLFHIVPPPKMSEWGGSKAAGKEETVATERRQMYEQMEKAVEEVGEKLLGSLQGVLTEKGIEVTVLPVKFEKLMDARHIARDILKTAEEGNYGTVVVGRHSFSVWQRLFRHHVGEELVRLGEDITVWVNG